MANITPEQASKILKRIRARNGWFEADDLQEISGLPDHLQDFVFHSQRSVADSTEMLGDQLYSEKIRFAYELIQNAEDNAYTQALTQGQDPSLIFKLYPDRIIVDSNEDGFLEKDVEAICSIWDSTKRKADGYIGEKGIGFKAVFKVARRVFIHSNPFHFSFEYLYKGENDGLGMLIPIEEEPVHLPLNVRTRMILLFSRHITYAQLEADFRTIPDTFFLFLKKLQKLTIEFHPETEGNAFASITYSKQVHGDAKISPLFLEKCETEGETEHTTKQQYLVVKSTLQNLPPKEAREVKGGKRVEQAEVVLAFPVDEADSPVKAPQHVFAFLPLRQAGFKFIIQSDFMTLANREEIVHSDRNMAIIAGVADLFRDTMVEFSNRPRMQWVWMRYLPDLDISSGIWKELSVLIIQKLRQTRILRALDGTKFRLPASLEILSPPMLDGNGLPLLADTRPPRCLSQSYASEDHHLLARLGTTDLSWENFVGLLRADLLLPDGASRWKNLNRHQSWRSRLSGAISRCYMEAPRCQKDILELQMIPISPSDWRSASKGGSIYFPTTNEVPVPPDLNFPLVHDSAVKNSAWKRLLSMLGVTELLPNTVIDSIYDKQGQSAHFPVLDLVVHARWFFYFLPEDASSQDVQILFATESLRNLYIEPATRFYFSDAQGKFGPSELFKKTEALPGYKANYLHHSYLDAVTPTVTVHGRTWLQWLEKIADVRRIPSLSVGNPAQLSPEFQYIINHRKDRLLETLKNHWAYYKSQLGKDVVRQLRRSRVISLNAVNYFLAETYLPLPKLREIATRIGILEAFPFAPVDRPLKNQEKLEWAFLDRFGVGIEDDINFYLVALNIFKKVNPTPDPHQQKGSLSQLYAKIQAKSSDDLESVEDWFQSDLIYVPDSGKSCARWTGPFDCVWDGPTWLRSKYRLNIGLYQNLRNLIVDQLKVQDACQKDILDDLCQLKEQEATVVQSDVDEIYSYLWEQHSKTESRDPLYEDLETMRRAFEKDKLVFIPQLKSWRAPSECVWAESHVKIPGKISIAGYYAQLKTFFTNKLKVIQPTKQMYVASLRAEARRRATSAEIKQIMGLISTLGVVAEDVAELRQQKVFPIRHRSGDRVFASAAKSEPIDFAIIDRKEHAEAFRGRISVLDLSLEEIRDIQPLLIACGLEDRFSSLLVKEATDVDDGKIDSTMTRLVRANSKAFVRCAVQFGRLDSQQNPASLYKILSRTTVYTSNSIQKSIHIKQGGKIFEGEQTVSSFHLEDYGDLLRLYVPEDRFERMMCFELQLPLRLCEFLHIPPSQARSILTYLFRLDEPFMVNKLLEAEGIGEVELGVIDSRDDPDVASLEALTNSLNLEEAKASKRVRDVIPGTRAHERESADTDPNQKSSSRIWDHYVSSSESSLELESPTIAPLPEPAYEQILKNVVSVARRRAASRFFETSPFRQEQLHYDDSLSNNTIKEVFGGRVPDRDFKLGAAGELYVFEYLKNLSLPNFDLENWKSSIRNRVGIHPDYYGIRNLSDSAAIADIEYEDDQGVMTSFLVETGHLAPGLWENVRPTYHIEVKATHKGDWQEPFFLSKNQERHIRDYQIRNMQTSSHVYLICRLFNLGRGKSTGFHIYVDPESKRKENELEFLAHTWVVKPLRYHMQPIFNNSGLFGATFADKGLSDGNASNSNLTSGESLTTLFVDKVPPMSVPSEWSRSMDIYQSVTSKEGYREHSFEELRLHDYNAGLKRAYPLLPREE